MLEKESQMYGAMDGAMKFVKGDAIAGLIIAAVNILGGLGVGVLQHNMELVKAAQLYAVLSIGDGLVSQIPSLFSSITAGIIVTKVSSDESMNLGADIGAQLLAYPKALLIGSAIITAFILMPGFPKFQFLLIGGIIAIVGYVLYSTKNKARPSAEDIAESPRAADAAALIGFQPLSIRLSPALFERAGGFRLEESLKSSSVRLSSELGFPLPTAAVKVDPSIGENQYEISVQEVLAASGKLFAGIVVLQGQAFANQRIDDMPWLENAVIAEQQTAANPPAGCMVLHESEILSQHAAFISASHAPDFLSIQEVRRILDAFSVTNDAVVNETLHHIQLPKIAEVLRLLLREGIPLRNMNAILQSLIEWAPVEKNAEALAERARVAQRRYISHAATSGTYELSAIMIDTALEDGIRQAIRVTPFGTTIDLPPQIQQDIARQIESSISEAPEGRPLAVVCSMDVRRLIRMLCEHIQPIPVVVSIQELTSEVIVHTIGRVSLQE
jgi:type III secretion protein V